MRIFIFMSMLTISGCMGGFSGFSEVPLVEVRVDEVDFLEKNLYIVKESIFNEFVKEEGIYIKEAPLSKFHFECAVLYPDEQDVSALLKNAKTIHILKGSYEEWIPINGAAKKYLVFQIQ